MRSYSALIGFVMVLATFLLLGCSADKQVTGPETPEQLTLPSLTTMRMDVDFFQSAQIDTESVRLGKLIKSPAAVSPAALKLNYLNAAVRVFFLNVVTYAALAEPVAAFATAIHSVPQYQQDGSWLWTYVFVDNSGSEYSIFLRGKRMDSYVAWSMEVSSNDPAMLLDHFLWFEGEVETDERSGYWQFYEPDSSAMAAATLFAGNETETPGVPCVRIDWRSSSAVDRRLAFLINKPEDTAEGSTLVFEEALEMTSIEFYDAASGNTGAIIWYREGFGSIEWPDYKDGVKSCWDVWQYDVVCE
jgi:hypothetical protein